MTSCDGVKNGCLDLFLLAGQSNAQGWKGDAAFYPADPAGLDKSIPFYWVCPERSSSDREWTHLKPQGGRFPTGHFGPEVTFARALKHEGLHPGIFKYSLGSTSLAGDWGRPGAGGMYDDMVDHLQHALSLLREQGRQVKVLALIWIQGESDAGTQAMSDAYKDNLLALIEDVRRVVGLPDLPVMLGLDEQHPSVQENPHVLHVQQEMERENNTMIRTSMLGLEKEDKTHLTPKGLEAHGLRLFEAYLKMKKDTP